MKNTKRNKYKIRNLRQTKRRNTREKNKVLVLKNRTPRNTLRLSKAVSHDIDDNTVARGKKLISYAPSINQNLVSLKSMPRTELVNCNTESAFQLNTPLQIAVPGSFFGRTCIPYDSPDARKFLLKNLQANKHIDAKKVIPPIQQQSNCWFNAMFVTLFISDKGRKFFHYFRQLMIEGKQSNGKQIPKGLRDAFALLNFAVESSLTGSRYAYKMDTNSVIKKIYDVIPDEYHKKSHYLVEVDKASNPIKYYNSIINYLGNNSLELLLVPDVTNTSNWRKQIASEIKGRRKPPHVIILEIYDKSSSELADKPTRFSVNNITYALDSSVVRDIEKQHFCATLTCEGKEMGYDGMSFHRLVPMKWKDKINKPLKWEFQGSNNLDGTPLEWSYRSSYHLLIYYRV